jgi:hypothetical protein
VAPPVATAPAASPSAPAGVQPQRALGAAAPAPLPAAGMDSLRQACDGTDGRACLNLANVYANGRGVPQDYGKAAPLYQRGCDLGAPRSCAALGFLYQRGLGVQADTAHARQLFQRACQGRDLQACALMRRQGPK